MQFRNLESYEIIQERYIDDLQSRGVLLKHKKSGARVALLSNDDENKVFSIGFRTPPKDSTGVAHILEHSVLCGSAKYPIKDPFVELVKGSMNTFLNAMTYPDKTMYPVASTNDKDFQNIMDVYLDAVFFPKIYDNPLIFKQEGWHYELSDLQDELKINGVVYNEMKGVMSSPEDIMEDLQMNSLFPDNTYHIISGGDPEDIPSLTYEQFLDFHKKYYHPSNSYIYLYGNMDMEEKLDYIDKEYLSRFDCISVDSSIQPQKPFDKMVELQRDFPISEDMDEGESGYLSLNWVVADCLDVEMNLAFQVIDYALCSAPGAPLKEALLNKGIGKDVYSVFQNGILQPYFSVISSNCDVSQKDVFLQEVDRVLEKVVKEGFKANALLAGLNYYEFKYREADFGSYPKGLMYGLQAMDSWLYDETKPFLHLEANKVFAALKEKISTGYFENLVMDYLIKNKHKSIVVMNPVKNLDALEEEKQKKHMAELKASMSQERLEEIIAGYRELTEYQEKEDKKEDLAKIPMLTRKDISREERKILTEERWAGERKVLAHPMYTNGIGYIRMVFHMNHVPEELFPYIGILKNCIGLMDTENYAYGDLFHKINLETGGMGLVVNVYNNVDEPDDFDVTMELKTKVFYDKIPEAFRLFREVITSTRYDDEKRLFEILQQTQSRIQAQMQSAGHSVVINRALSYGTITGELNEIISGIPYYRLLSEILKNYDEEKENLIQKLKQLSGYIFVSNTLEADYVGEEKAYAAFAEQFKEFANGMPVIDLPKERFVPQIQRKNEGFMTTGKVQFVGKAGNFRKAGLPYHGALRLLKVCMEYQYLWENIRVKGGAYGCMCGFGKSGDSYLVSYRDPHLKNTLKIYEEAVEMIRNFEADERTMDQFIIGAISDLDTPMTPSSYGLFSMVNYRSKVTQEFLKKEREQILSATVEDIRALAVYMEAILAQDYLCVVGASRKLKENESFFMNMENLV